MGFFSLHRDAKALQPLPPVGVRREANAYQVESLEPRIYLSAAPVDLALVTVAAADPVPEAAAAEVVQHVECGAQVTTAAAQSAGAMDYLFGATEALPTVAAASLETVNDAVADGQNVAGGGNEEVAVKTTTTTTLADQTNVSDPTDHMNTANTAGQTDTQGDATTTQIVDTLRAGNGPPGTGITSLPGGGRLIDLNPDNSAQFGSQLVVQPGDVLKGTGGDLALVNQGTWSPGHSPAITSVASFTQVAGATTIFEIGGTTVGTEYDRTAITGNVILDGRATVAKLNLGNGWVPTVGQSFTIMTWGGTRTGQFNQWLGTVADVGADLAWVPVYDDVARTLTLTIRATPGYNPIKTQVENLIHQVGAVGDKIDQIGALAAQLPFIGGTVASILDQKAAIQTVLEAKLAGLTGTLSVADVTSGIEGFEGQVLAGFTIHVDGVLAKFGTLITDPVSWDVDLRFTRADVVNFTLGSTAAFSAGITATGTVNSTLHLDFTFGKDATDYYITVRKQEAIVSLNTTVTGSVSVTLPAGVSVLTATGPAVFNGNVSVMPNPGILSGVKIYLSTLTSIGSGGTSAVTNFTFTPTGDLNVDLTLAASSAINLGGGITISGGANAHLTIVGANVFTAAPDVDFHFVNGTLGLGVSYPGIEGTFNLNSDGTTTYIEATITRLRLMVGTNRLLDMTGTASFVLANGEVAGKADLTLALGPVAGIDLTMTGTWHLEINTSADAVNVPYAGGTVSVAGGHYVRVELENGTLSFTINPTFTLAGNFVFEQNGVGAAAVTAIGASNVSFSFGDDTHPNLISITNGAGILVMKSSGIAGSLTGTLTETIPGVDLAGTFTVIMNDTGAAMVQSVTVGGVTQTVNAPAGIAGTGSYLKIVGTGTTVTVAGVTLTGNFTYENYNTLATHLGPKVIAVGASNVTGSLTVGATNLVTLTNGSGAFLITNDGLAGTATVTYALAVPQVSVSTAGTATLTINQTGTAVNTTVDVGLTANAPIIVQAGPYVKVETTGAVLSLLGANGVTVSGNFAYERYTTVDGDVVVKLAATNANLQLGAVGNVNLIQVANASGYFLINTNGIAGKAMGTVTVAGALSPLVSLTGVFSIVINTTPTDVSEDFTINAATEHVEARAGPYVKIYGTGVAMTVNLGAAGSVVVNGNFVFEQKKDSVTHALDYIAVGGSAISVNLSAVGFTVAIMNGVGGFRLTTAGIAGQASASTITFSAVVGLTLEATNVIFKINNTNADVSSTTVVVSPTENVTFSYTGAYYRNYIGITGAVKVKLTVPITFEVDGDFSFELYHTVGGNVIRLAASNVSADLKIGSNPALMSFNNGSGAFVISSAGVAGTAMLSFQTGFVTVSGTIKLEINTTALAANYTWTDPAGATFTIALTNPNYVLVCVNGHVTVGSFDVPVNFQIRQTAAGLFFETKPALVEIFHLDSDGTFHAGTFISFPATIDFANPSPEDILTFLQTLANWFSLFSGSSIFDTMIPFTDKTLGDAVDFAKGFIDSFYNKLVSAEIAVTLPAAGVAIFPASGAITGGFSITIGTTTYSVSGLSGTFNGTFVPILATLNARIAATVGLAGKIEARLNRNGSIALALTESEMSAGTLQFNIANVTGGMLTMGFPVSTGSATISRYLLAQFPLALSRILGIAGNAVSLPAWTWTTALPSAPATLLPYAPITYDAHRKVYVFPVNFTYAPVLPDVDFHWATDIGPLGSATLSGKIKFEPSLHFGFDLGLDLNSKEVPRIISSQALPTPTNGRVSADVIFKLYVNGSVAPITITLLKATTDNNTTANDLVADLNAALTAAADYTLPGGGTVDLAQIVVFQKAGPVIALSVLQEDDLDGDGHIDVQEDVNRNGVLDAGEDIDGDGNLDIKEDLNSDGDMLDDYLGLLNQLKMTVDKDNPFATELGFGDEIKDPSVLLGYIHGYFQSVVNSAMKGIFIDNLDLSATLKITTPTLITGSLNFGFLKVTVSGGQVTTTDPYTHVAKDIRLALSAQNPTTGSKRFYLPELMDVLTNIGTYIQGPDLTGALYAGFANVTAKIGSHTLFNTGEISIWIPKIMVLTYNAATYNITDLLTTNDEGTFLTFPHFGLGGGAAFQKISFTDVLHGLQTAVDTISDFSAFSFLNEKIPLINISVHDLVDYAGQFADLIDSISSSGSGNIQDMLTTLKANVVTLFHIDPTAFDIDLDTNGIVYGNGVTVSTGGTAGTGSKFTFNPNGLNNGFTITSTVGTTFNTSQLVLMGDPHVTGNTATATWDSVTKILTILIDANNTTANAIVTAINGTATVNAVWTAALVAMDTAVANNGTGKIKTNAIKFSFHYTAAYANQLPLQLDLADLVNAMGNDNPTIKQFLQAATSLIHVGGSGMLNVSASAAATLDFGLDLTSPCSPSLFIYDTTGVSLTAKVTATALNFDASIGALGIYIKNGTVTFDYDGKGGSTNPAIISLTLKDVDGDGRHSIDATLLSFDNIALVAHVGITAVLPLFAPTATIAVGSTTDANGDGYPDNALVLDVPDLIRLLVNDTTSLNATNHQEARLIFRGSANDLTITKVATGGSALTIEFHHDAALGLGSPTVALSGNALSITINSGVTTRAQLTGLAWWAANGFTATAGAAVPDTVVYAADTGKLRKFTLYAPDLNGLFANLDLCALIDSATGPFLTGLDGALKHIQDGLTEAVGSTNLPLIGDGLAGVATFIQNFREGLLAELRARVAESGGAIGALQDAIKNAIWNSLGPAGLDLLVNYTTGEALDASAGSSQLDVVLSCDGLAVNIRLKKSLALLDTTQNPIDFDLGVDGFGLSVDGNVILSLGFDLKLGFGFNKSDGFYIVTSDGSGDPELDIGFSATIPGLHAKGALFFLQLDVNDDPTAPSSFVGHFMVDLRDPNSDGKLTWAEITSSGTSFGDIVHADLEAIADVNLNLVASFGGNTNFPTVLADFNLDWSWTLSGGSTTPDLAFNNVRLDLGTFISNVLGPVLAKIQEITGPIQPIIDIAVARIPIISDLAGKDITFLDLAEAFGYLDPGTRKFIEQVIKIVDLINSVPTGGGSVIIPIGSFHLGQASDGNYTSVNPLGSLDASDLAERISAGIDSTSTAGSTQVSQTSGFVGDQGIGSLDNFKIPFIQNPSELFNLFTGGSVRLVEWQMPTFKFEFTYTQKIPIYPPLYAQFGGTIGAQFDIGIGYDTSGIQKFIEGGAKDVAQIFDGFYLADYDANGHERPEVTLKGSIFAGVSLNLGIAEVGVNGGIEAVITFDLNDITKDGYVHVSELIAEAQQDIRCIFDIHGELRVFLEAFLKVNLLFFKIDKTWRFGDFLLFSFDITCPVPTLAEVNAGTGVLTLNMGENAGDRLEIDTTDSAETFTVTHISGDAVSGEKVSVTWRNYTQEFEGVKTIYARAGVGNDYLDLTGTLAKADVDMGSGDDTLILGWGAGSTVRGGTGNDKITAPTDDQTPIRNTGNIIYGDDGNDTLTGPGNTSVTIYGGGGTDIITGSSMNDILDGGDGADTITGGSGDDTITGGAGNDKIYGNDGNDIIDAGAGADFVEGGSGNDSINGGSGSDEVYGDDGNDKIAGGSGDDKLYGNGGADLIVGDEFNLTLFTYDLSTAATAGGTFTISTITGTGNDFIVGGGSYDVLFGGDGNDFVFGGNYFADGSTQVVEDDDNDFIDGGRGDDQLFGDDANGKEGDRDTGISITSYVWHDLDLDGVKDATEPGLANVNVYLYKSSDNSLFSSTKTDASGKFSLTGLDPLDYYLKFSIPAGFTPTLINVGDGLPSTDLDSAAELGTDSDIDATGKTAVFQMDYNEAETTIGAGFTGVPKLTITSAAVNEGAKGAQTSVTFTYTLSGPSLSTISLNYYTTNGLATGGKDFTTVASTLLTFNPGETGKTVTVFVTGDDTYELDEDFTLVSVPTSPVLLSGSPASFSNQVYIVNDDARPAFTITDAIVTEPGVSQLVKISIKLTNPSYQTVTVGYQTSDEFDSMGLRTQRSATAVNDYQVLTGVATFLPGDVQKDVYVKVFGDLIDEYDETFFLKLVNPSNATVSDDTGSILIRDDDVAPKITLTPVTPDGGAAPLNFRTTAYETDTVAVGVQFNVSIIGLTEKTITVRYDTARGTAISDSYDELTEPIDFTNNATALDFASSADSDTTLTFVPGSSTTQTFTVWVQPDDKAEGDEFFYTNLLNAENAEIANNHVIVKIVDDDVGPAGVGNPFDVRFSRPDFHVAEGDSATTGYVTLIRSLTSTVAYTVLDIGGGTATFGTDFTTGAPLVRQLITFTIGEAVKLVPIYVVGDNIHEADETIFFNLRKPTGEPVKGYPGAATMTIEDDDDVAVIVETVPVPNSVVEGTTYQFRIRLVDYNDPLHPDIVTSVPVTVAYGTTALTATAGGVDYTNVAGTYTFPVSLFAAVGFVKNVITVNDATAEATEQFRFSIAPTTSGVFTVQAFVDGNITDNDTKAVGAYVYVDANNNGYKDVGEAGVSGATVTLTDSSNTAYPLTTNASGYFSANVLYGTVHVAVDGTGVLEGYEVTTANDNQDVTFTAGSAPITNIGYLIGFTLSLPKTAETTGRGGTDDTIFGGPGNDYIDAGAGDDHVVGGHWQTATSTNSPINQGTYDAIIVANVGGSITNPQTAPIWSISTAGLGGGNISGQAWVDTNNSNVQDEGLYTGEVYVTLLDGAGNVVNVLATTTGTYSFTGLYKGTYIVQWDLPSGQQFVTPGIGGAAVNSDAVVAGRTAKLSLATDTSTATNIDAGLEASGTLPVASGSTIQFSQSSYHAVESATVGGHTFITITMVRSNAASVEAVAWFMHDGTALASTNYVKTQGVVTFGIGETLKSFDIELISTGQNICDAKDFSLSTRKPTGQPIRGGETTIYIHGAAAASNTDDDTIYAGEDWDVVLGDSGYIDAIALPNTASTKIHDTGGLGHDTIYGDDGPDYLNGQLGNDVISGGEGDDIVVGGYGDDRIEVTLDDDTISGGNGTDTVFGTYDGAVIQIDAAKVWFSLDTTVNAGDSEFTLTGIESLELYGGAGTNSFIVNGWAGEAFLFGGGGTDALQVTNDMDMTLADSPALQKLLYALLRGMNVEANLTLITTGTAYHIGEFETVSLTGGASNNIIDASGYSHDVTLSGGAGDDTLIGGSGNDTFFFVADTALGTDTITGNGGKDTLDFSATLAGVTVNLATVGASQTVNGNLKLVLSALDIENVTGGAGVDALTGNSLDNVIIGGASNDTLTGGTGSDTYRFNADTALGTDTIIENSADAGEDTLDFSLTTLFTINLDMALTTAQVINGNLSIILTGGGFENAMGGALNDDLKGNSLANKLYGMGGDDKLFGAQGDDYLDGGDGTDTLDGGEGTDSISANADSAFQLTNTLLSRNGGDVDYLNLIERATLTGGVSANIFTLTGWTGFATLNGAGGNDTLIYTADINMTLTGAAGTDMLSLNGGAYTFSMTSVESYILTGGVSANTLNANGYTSGGSVTLDGAAGNDTLVGSAGTDTLRGGSGNDIISGGASYDYIDGGTGTDTLLELNASTVTLTNSGYTINGGTDSLTSIENLSIVGTAGNDTFTVSGSPSTNVALNGGGGVGDKLHVDTSYNATLTNSSLALSNLPLVTITLSNMELGELYGSAGANVLNAGGFSGTVTLSGGAGNDTLSGGSGNDTLDGGAGDDTYKFNTNTALGTDSIVDASGTDTLDFSGSTAGVTVNLTLISNVNANLTLTWAAGVSVENIIGGNGADNLTGTTGDNKLTGGAGNDQLNGGAGDDTYIYNTDTALGTDSVTDTGGTDTLDFSASTSTITVNLANATNVVNANLTINYFGTIDNVIGGSGNDFLTGGVGNNQLTGGAGTDSLDGGAGDDTYLFDTDTALGTDTIADVSGTDTLDFSASALAVSVDLNSTSNVVNANLTLNWLAGVTLENVIGGSGNDTLSGNSSANVLTGGAGNDALNGRSGNDTYAFNTDTALGTDTISDNAGTDVLDFSASTTAVSVNLDQAAVLGTVTNVVNARLTLRWASTVTLENLKGGSGNDTLIGNASANNIQGGAGDDTIDGRAGNNTLIGSTGDDTYLFDVALAGDNTITELAGEGDDTLDGAGGGLVDFSWTTFNAPDVAYPSFRIKFTNASTVEHSL